VQRRGQQKKYLPVLRIELRSFSPQSGQANNNMCAERDMELVFVVLKVIRNANRGVKFYTAIKNICKNLV
jgi:hypothetical protein